MGGPYRRDRGRGFWRHGSHDNYQIEKATATLNATTRVVLVPAPPSGVSYRILYVNGLNTIGGNRFLYGDVNDGAGNFYRCLEAFSNTASPFIKQVVSAALAEYPTIAVLDSSNETFEVSSDASNTGIITAFYEVVDETGPRTYRNSMATANGASEVTLLFQPKKREAYRIFNVNGLNATGVTQNLFLWNGSGKTEALGQLQALNTVTFRTHLQSNQSPFPPLYLLGSGDSLIISMSANGTANIIASYEVLTRQYE